MVRERSEDVERRKDLSTDARGRGGTARSSGEALVMRVERRGSSVQVLGMCQPAMGGTCDRDQVARNTEATRLQGLERGQEEPRGSGSGWAKHRGVRRRSWNSLWTLSVTFQDHDPRRFHNHDPGGPEAELASIHV